MDTLRKKAGQHRWLLPLLLVCVGVAVLRTALEQAPLALYAPPALWGWGAAVLLGAGLTARQARRWLAAPGVG